MFDNLIITNGGIKMTDTITITREEFNRLQNQFEATMNACQRETDLRMLERQHEQQLREKEIEHELNKKSGFSDFTMFNNKNMEYLVELVRSDPTAGSLFLFIAKNMDNYNALIASYQVFQEALSLSRATVARAIKSLKEAGILYVYKSGSSNVYVLNDDLVWRSYGNNRKYCKFPVNVMLAASEQDDAAKDRINKVRIASQNYTKTKELVPNDK